VAFAFPEQPGDARVGQLGFPAPDAGRFHCERRGDLELTSRSEMPDGHCIWPKKSESNDQNLWMSLGEAA
jgi:hypothetical protein